jgi:tRNA uridine 5-carbamoylmethylation protein Kti12
VLSKDAIVIADDLNYIKGFRYQLWCEAKAAGTRCCTIHCAAREDEVEGWNRARLRQWAALKGEVLPDEAEATTTADSHIQNTENISVNLPESHTALYGDRIPDMLSRSRSSSMDADDGEDATPLPSTLMEESLKSFSLTDRNSVPMAKHASPERVDDEDNNLASSRSAEGPAITMLEFSPPSSAPYSPNTLQSLLMRYEPPSPFSRWDTPLFTIPACDLMPPVSAIWDAIFPTQSASSKKGGITEPKAEVKPNAATVLPQATEADALQTLERITADVVTQIIAWVKEHAELGDEGGSVQIRISDAQASLSVPPGTALSVPMLQRLRRRFTQIQRGGIAHGRGHVQGEAAVGEAFVRFLNGEIGV